MSKQKVNCAKGTREADLGHAVLSASGSHRWLNCTPSARLELEFENTTSEAAREGTAAHQVDNDTLQQVIEYLIFNNGGNITVQALCSLTGKFAEVGAEFQRLHSMSATERMNDLYTTIERPNGQLMEHQRKMLNVLFRVFAQNFRCVSSYIPKVYTGKMRVFDCESAIANFFPSLFSEDKKTWEQYAQGEFLFDTMKGDHISCMNSPYIEENVKKILDL